MNRNRLYLLLTAGLIAGYAWVAWSFFNPNDSAFTPCMFKNTTGIACPSCGSTRSVMALAHGHVNEAALINPMGFVIVALMVVLPFWLIYDVVASQDSLYKYYQQFELTLKRKKAAIILILLIIINWGWNIYKGL